MNKKNELQEHCMKTGLKFPTYNTYRLGGSDHQPVFRSVCTISATPPIETFGVAHTKTFAEIDAASQMMAFLFLSPPTVNQRDIVDELRTQLEVANSTHRQCRATMKAAALKIIQNAVSVASQLDPDLSGEIKAGSFNPYGNGQTGTQSFALASLRKLSATLMESRGVLSEDVFDNINQITQAAILEASSQLQSVPTTKLIYDAVRETHLREPNLDLRKCFTKASILIGFEINEQLKHSNGKLSLTVTVSDVSVTCSANNIKHLQQVAYDRLYNKLMPTQSLSFIPDLDELLSHGPMSVINLRKKLRAKQHKFRKDELHRHLYTNKEKYISVVESECVFWSLI